MNRFGHTPVMVEEVIRFMRCGREGFYIDVTAGGGGHARAILDASSPSGRLFGIDRDPDAVKAAREALSRFGDRARIERGAFSEIGSIAGRFEVPCANGMLADLGVSSHQIEEVSRGFAFMKDGPLDMRMDPELGVSAADVVRDAGEEELSQMIFELGEERYARKIARGIAAERIRRPIMTTKALADVIARSVPAGARHGRIHPATRTFQALRIRVNDELGELGKFLEDGPPLLCSGGRLVVISYHSLEDRLVKTSFRELEKKGGFKVVTKKIVTPGEEEIETNPRARSAKLRVLEKE